MFAASEGLGRYLASIDRGFLLAPCGEKRLPTRARAGCARSKRTLTEMNLRLVVSVAKRYRGRGLGQRRDQRALVVPGFAPLFAAHDDVEGDRIGALPTAAPISRTSSGDMSSCLPPPATCSYGTKPSQHAARRSGAFLGHAPPTQIGILGDCTGRGRNVISRTAWCSPL